MTDQATEVVESRPSEIHGTGVFAVETIEAGALVGRYVGDPSDVDGTYFLWVENDDGGWDGIDGTGVLRFLNHSSEPNVEFDGPELFAVRDIAVGEELTFHYGDEWDGVP
ncbi:MAG: SET domain-containing protein-lysine N-methyltransferase [Actinomycetota bacterium]